MTAGTPGLRRELLAALDLVRTDVAECRELKEFAYDLIVGGRVSVYFEDDSHLRPAPAGYRAVARGDSHRNSNDDGKAGKGAVDVNYVTNKDDPAQMAETLIHEGGHVMRADGWNDSAHASITSTAKGCVRR